MKLAGFCKFLFIILAKLSSVNVDSVILFSCRKLKLQVASRTELHQLIATNCLTKHCVTEIECTRNYTLI
jgi:hypothetical protein